MQKSTLAVAHRYLMGTSSHNVLARSDVNMRACVAYCRAVYEREGRRANAA